MVRRAVRWMLWGVKGLLLAVAAGAVFLWGWSYGHSGAVVVWRWANEGGTYCRAGWFASWADGRVGIGRVDERYEGSRRGWVRVRRVREEPGWVWDVGVQWWDYHVLSQTSATGPFVTTMSMAPNYGPLLAWRVVAAPCYLLALTAGAWPLTSLALLARRRRRARRLLHANRCRRCGYDLRATPDAAGPRLAVCPKCGAAS